MSRKKKAPVGAEADSKKSRAYSSKPASRYKTKQYQRSSLGKAMLAALEVSHE